MTTLQQPQERRKHELALCHAVIQDIMTHPWVPVDTIAHGANRPN